MAETKARDIGIDIEMPEKTCDDPNCPFHGILAVRGQIIKGKVVSDKMDKTVIVEKERLMYIRKYERYEKRTTRLPAHKPPCIDVDVGDEVMIMECRPLSKTKSFVVVGR